MLTKRLEEFIIQYRSLLRELQTILGITACSPKKRFTAKVRGGLENNMDLWRGVIDGDGTMGIYRRVTPRGTVRDIPYISLTGSLHVCLQFKAFLENAVGIPMPNIIPYKRSYMFSVSDHRALNSIKLLYEGCTVALERKLIVAQKIMNSFQVLSSSIYIKRSG